MPLPTPRQTHMCDIYIHSRVMSCYRFTLTVRAIIMRTYSELKEAAAALLISHNNNYNNERV